MVRLTSCSMLLMFLIAGCTSVPTPPAAPEPPPPSVPGPPSREPPGPEPSLTLALRDQAEEARGRGDYDAAIATLERAIRIDPDAPELWLLLGQVNLDAGDAAAAEQFARKALQFVGARADLEQRAYTLIDAAEKAQR